MNALRLSLLALALAVTACGPADASIDGEEFSDVSGELTASSHFETFTGKDEVLEATGATFAAVRAARPQEMST